MSQPELRIGEVARLAGATPRTIRCYEEIGLLPVTGGRQPGATAPMWRPTSTTSHRAAAGAGAAAAR